MLSQTQSVWTQVDTQGGVLVPIVQDAFPLGDGGVMRVACGQIGHLKRVRLGVAVTGS